MEGPSDNDERRERDRYADEVGAWLRRLARGLLFDAHGADDAVQDAWVAALSRPERPSNSAWLGGAVRNLALGKRRDDARRRAREQRAALPEALPSAADAAARIEVARRVLDAVERLDEPYRAAVLARFFDGEPPRAIARRHGVPVNTARTWVRRGLERLRRDLDPSGANAEDERGRFLLALAPLAGPAPWPITLGLPDAAWRTAAKWTGGLAMGKALTAAAAAAVVLALVLAVARGGSAELRDAGSAEAARALEPSKFEADAVGATELASTADEGLASANLTENARRPVLADTPSWEIAGTALLGTSALYPGMPLVARILDARPGAAKEPLAEQRLVAGERGEVTWRVAAPEHSVRVELVPVLDDAIVYPTRELVPFGEPAPTAMTVRAYPFDLSIVGRVTEASGAPLLGAKVGIYQDREQATTDANGAYRVRSSSLFGDVAIHARAEGYATGTTSVHVLGEPVQEAETLVLVPELRVFGRVTDAEGRSIAFADVRDSPWGGAEVSTNEDGRYVLPNLDPSARRINLYVWASGFAPYSESFDCDGAQPGDEIEHDVVLGRAGIVRGVVNGADGAPLEGVSLTLGYSPEAYPQVSTISGPTGAFEMTSTAGEQTLWAERKGCVTARRQVDVPEQGALVVEITLLSGGVVTGSVVDMSGAPIPFAPVAPARPGWEDTYLAARTNAGADGRFRFDQMPDEPFTLEAFPPGHRRATVELPGLPDEPVVIELQRACKLVGRVVDAGTRAPLEEFTIRFVAPALEPGEQRIWGYGARWSGPGQPYLDTHGRFEARDELDCDGWIGVEASAPGYAPSVNDRVRIGAAEKLVFELGRGATLRGRVVDEPTRLPIAGALVRRFGRGERVDLEREPRGDVSTRWDAVTDANGRFEMHGLPLGASVLAVRADGHPDLVDAALDARGHGAVIDRELVMPSGGIVRGAAIDVAGAPVAAGDVALSPRDRSAGRGSRVTTTDAEGRFAFENVPAGAYQVSLLAEGEGPNGSRSYLRSRLIDVGAADEVEVELGPIGSAIVAGRVRSALQLPDGVTVSLMPAGTQGMDDVERTRRTSAVIARDGHFEIDGLAAGAYRVLASARTDAGWVTDSVDVAVANGGVADVVLELKAR